jgi:thiamine biosynthesis protein ThiS
VPSNLTLDQVLRYLDVNPEQVAVEKDRAIVRKSEWSSTLIQAGSGLEIVQFVGGG